MQGTHQLSTLKKQRILVSGSVWCTTFPQMEILCYYNAVHCVITSSKFLNYTNSYGCIKNNQTSCSVSAPYPILTIFLYSPPHSPLPRVFSDLDTASVSTVFKGFFMGLAPCRVWIIFGGRAELGTNCEHRSIAKHVSFISNMDVQLFLLILFQEIVSELGERQGATIIITQKLEKVFL
jgi:hypothetical protein